MTSKYPAIEYLLKHSRERGLFPEERDELQSMLGRLARLECVYADAEVLCNAVDAMTEQVLVPDPVCDALDQLYTRVGSCIL